MAGRVSFGTLLFVDFFCALTGGLVYHFWGGLIIELFRVSYEVLAFQIAANFSYAAFGFTLILAGHRLRRAWPMLVWMNFAYSIVCFGLSVHFINTSRAPAASLLALEGLFIVTLAFYERAALKATA
ncbi:MAG TPA: hypothetical protein VFV50_08315 [Bdellovibrionales bacterium]|nr:hypothetical protein [Bdellovibrionales bacterium]